MKTKKHLQSRRKFLKTSTLSALGVVAVGITHASSKEESETQKDSDDTSKDFSLLRKVHDRIEDVNEIDPNYKRMDEINTIFGRGTWDKKIKPAFISWAVKFNGMVPNPIAGTPGHSQLEFALEKGGWAGLHSGIGNGYVPNGGGTLNTWETHTTKLNKKKYKFSNPASGSKHVKRAARFLGADDVGIAPFDERWVYSKWFDVVGFKNGGGEGNPPHLKGELPFKPKSVISVVLEMDYDAHLGPGLLNGAAAGLEYSHMAEVTHKIAVFLNNLGYKAIPCGNDTGLSIPIAIQAGMGELSRMGTLINEKYGSRVRLAKVFTDLELRPDKPVTFGVHEFCKKCKKCAEYCPSNSISLETEPTAEPTTGSISSHPGVKKWFQNNETCFKYWEKNGGCGVCLQVCPYNKLDTWVHDVSKLAVGAPIGRDIARQMDDMFGYGKIRGQKYVDKFWNKED